MSPVTRRCCGEVSGAVSAIARPFACEPSALAAKPGSRWGRRDVLDQLSKNAANAETGGGSGRVEGVKARRGMQQDDSFQRASSSASSGRTRAKGALSCAARFASPALGEDATLMCMRWAAVVAEEVWSPLAKSGGSRSVGQLSALPVSLHAALPPRLVSTPPRATRVDDECCALRRTRTGDQSSIPATGHGARCRPPARTAPFSIRVVRCSHWLNQSKVLSHSPPSQVVSSPILCQVGQGV